jgi:hypothetical protein
VLNRLGTVLCVRYHGSVYEIKSMHCAVPLTALQHLQEIEDPEEAAKRIASQWTHDPESTGAEQADEPSTDDTAPTQPSGDAAGSPPAVGESDKPESTSVFSRLAGTVKSISSRLSSGKAAPSGGEDDLVALTEASKEAVQAHGAKSSELREAETKLKAAQTLLDQVCSLVMHMVSSDM